MPETLTYPDVPVGQQLQILIEAVPGSGEYTKRCSINLSRSIQFNSQTSETFIPPCEAGDNPDGEDAAWSKINVTGLSAPIEGSGYHEPADFPFFFNWWKSGQARNVKVRVNKAGAWLLTGAYKLTGYGVSGEYNAETQNTMSFASHGALVLSTVPAPPPEGG